jgi:hypothetical protein
VGMGSDFLGYVVEDVKQGGGKEVYTSTTYEYKVSKYGEEGDSIIYEIGGIIVHGGVVILSYTR